MKKVLIAIVLLASAMTASARGSHSGQLFRIGAGGAFSSTWLLNSNVSSIGDSADYEVTFGGQGGLCLEYDFTETTGIEMGILFSGHNQKHKGVFGSVAAYNSEVSLRYIDIPILFKVGSMGQGAFFEIGPQIGILASASEDFTLISFDEFSYSGRDVKSQFNGVDFAGVIGVGGSIEASDKCTINIGLRLGYSFTDATVEYSSEMELALVQVAEKSSWTDIAAHYSDKHSFSYKPTNKAFGGLFVSVMFNLD